MKLSLNNKTVVNLDDRNSVGEGGEAWAIKFSTGGSEFVAKVYKGPDCVDYEGDTEQDRANREGAKRRMDSFADKLQDFPKGLPDNVISPIDLMYKDNKPRAFYMPLVPEPREPYRKYCDAGFRQSGIDTNEIIQMLVRLHDTVLGCHKAGLILGDFNDLNLLGPRPFIIDAESGSYGGHQCTTFTQRFVDPLLCDNGQSRLMLCKPHTELSDLYAFVCMVFQGLFLISPYEGVYKPKDKSKRCPQDARPLHRRTVLDPETKWPKWAQSLGLTPKVMPDDLMHQFELVFHEDERVFPIGLLKSLRWTKCTSCGAEHARGTCPECATPGIVRSVTEVKGTVTSERIFRTSGVILAAAYQNGMRWLSYESESFRREDGISVLKGVLMPRVRYRIMGNKTCLAHGGSLITLGPKDDRLSVDTFGQLPVFDCNSRFRFRIDVGRLLGEEISQTSVNPEISVGQVLRGQTLFWVGEKFGFGFYRAAELSEFFVFEVGGIIKDGLDVQPLRGQLVDTTCSFSSDRCWFFASYESGGKSVNRCSVIDKTGNVLGHVEEDAGSDTWLGSLRGKCAVGHFLFAATDDGIVRVECESGTISVTRSFPDTEPFVDANCHLFPGDQCLHVVTKNEVRKLSIR